MRNVDVEIEIHVSPAKIIDAFIRQDMLHGWWGVERSYIEPQAGGIYLLVWGISPTGIKYTSSGIIASFHPASHLHIHKFMYINSERPILGPQELRVDITSNETGSHLHLSQGPYPENAGPDWDWYYDAVVDAWPRVLGELKTYLEATSVL